jgi:acetyl-CoA synthetase
MSYYKVDNLEQYFKHYNKSVQEPRNFGVKSRRKILLGTTMDKVVDLI